MTAIQVVRDACQKGEKQRALDAHEILLNKANHFAQTQNHQAAYEAGAELFESASLLQCLGVNVDKFPTV